MTEPVDTLIPDFLAVAEASRATRHVCIEGWRGVNHSIAMVNQHQLLALLGRPELKLYHRDLPFFLKHWNAAQMPAGFAPADQARLMAVPPPPEDQPLDCVLRVSSPFLTRFTPGQKTLTFMVTEAGLVPECFDEATPELAAFTRDDNRIVTPSRWSRDRLVEHGLDGDRIHVVPHGVKADVFTPLSDADRANARRMLGVGEGEALLLNVGVATWNKGLDLLLPAYAQVRQRHPHVRLLLKDHRDLYRFGVERTIAEVQRAYPTLITDEVLAGIMVVSVSLDQAQMRTLYAAADAYVSPYRAEGFNLPVLEAMACGTPVVVTDGGATDDFCPPDLAWRVASRPGRPDEAPPPMNAFRVPLHDALVEALEAVALGCLSRHDPRRLLQRHALISRLSWPAVCAQLAQLF